MTPGSDNDVRHEGTSFEPVPSDPVAAAGHGTSYPPEAEPDKGGDLPDAEVPGQQTDPEHRFPDEDGAAGESAVTQDDLVTPGSVEPPD